MAWNQRTVALFIGAFALAVPVHAANAKKPSDRTTKSKKGAAQAEDALKEARSLYVGLRFKSALRAVDRALDRANNRTDLIAIYELQGLALAALGREWLAREAFARLLTIDPEHKLPEHVAPRIRLPLVRARIEHEKLGWLRASLSAPDVIGTTEPVTIAIRMENDPLGIASRYRLSHRMKGETEIQSKEVRVERFVRIGLRLSPEALTDGRAIEYWCTLLDAHGSELAFLGTIDDPRVITIDATRDTATGLATRRSFVEATPVWQQWWFLTAAGIVVAGAITAGIVYALPDDKRCDSKTMSCGDGIY